MPGWPTRSSRLTRRQALAGLGAAAIIPTRGLAKDLQTLSMQSAYINDSEFLGYYVAIDKGFYRQEGLDLHYLPGGPDIIPESALLSGTADIALTEPDTTIQAILHQGAPFRIIGAQFQTSPMGIISLDSAPVRRAADLIGKTVSVSAVSRYLIHAFLRLNGIAPGQVRIVPDSQSSPVALLSGAVDAACGFVTDFPFAVRQQGRTPVVFLLADGGLPLFNDTVVVREDTLAGKRSALVAWLKASRRGWIENFRDPAVYPQAMRDTWLAPSGRTVAYDVFSNTAYQPLMTAPGGIFAMSEDSIAHVIASLTQMGIPARRDMFDTTLLADAA
jgi:ABC-type nitrate/sulfonate/bicarbonate transport system substrate-binding protein